MKFEPLQEFIADEGEEMANDRHRHHRHHKHHRGGKKAYKEAFRSLFGTTDGALSMCQFVRVLDEDDEGRELFQILADGNDSVEVKMIGHKLRHDNDALEVAKKIGKFSEIVASLPSH